MALSSDSTCVRHLYSAQDGYETLHLEKMEPESSSSDLMEEPAQCIFPDWMQGKWEGLSVDNGQMVFRDEKNFVTYSGKCKRNTQHTDRFVVNLNTDCGTPAYYCALFQQRDVNVMEFQLGKFTNFIVF